MRYLLPPPLLVTGPADNEIWYTTVDGKTALTIGDSNLHFGDSNWCDNIFIENTYNNGIGKLIFANPITTVSSIEGGWSIFTYDDGSNTYFSANRIKSVIFPKTLNTIGFWTLGGCSDLTEITIPNSVISIGDCAFQSCSALTSITYEGTQEQWNAISKGNYWNTFTSVTYVKCTDGQVTL